MPRTISRAVSVRSAIQASGENECSITSLDEEPGRIVTDTGDGRAWTGDFLTLDAAQQFPANCEVRIQIRRFRDVTIDQRNPPLHDVLRRGTYYRYSYRGQFRVPAYQVENLSSVSDRQVEIKHHQVRKIFLIGAILKILVRLLAVRKDSDVTRRFLPKCPRDDHDVREVVLHQHHPLLALPHYTRLLTAGSVKQNEAPSPNSDSTQPDFRSSRVPEGVSGLESVKDTQRSSLQNAVSCEGRVWRRQ